MELPDALRDLETLRVGGDAGVARITLARPDKLNALSPLMLEELLGVFAILTPLSDVHAIVVTGEGRSFSAGVDLDSPFFMENVESDSPFEGWRLLESQHWLIKTVYDAPQPTLALVNGDAVGGGGFGLAMACDMRFAVRSARFWMIPAKVNVVQDFGLTWTLQRAIGTARTMEMVFSGQPVDAEAAERYGFVNRCFDDMVAMEEHVAGLLKAIAHMAPDSVRLLKRVVRHGSTADLDNQLALEAIANGLCFQSDEFIDAKSAMLSRLRTKRS